MVDSQIQDISQSNHVNFIICNYYGILIHREKGNLLTFIPGLSNIS